jgi:hypothetical protein
MRSEYQKTAVLDLRIEMMLIALMSAEDGFFSAVWRFCSAKVKRRPIERAKPGRLEIMKVCANAGIVPIRKPSDPLTLEKERSILPSFFPRNLASSSFCERFGGGAG